MQINCSTGNKNDLVNVDYEYTYFDQKIRKASWLYQVLLYHGSFKMKGYFIMGCNFAIISFVAISLGVNSERKDCASNEQILFFRSRLHFDRKQCTAVNLVLFCKNGEKIWRYTHPLIDKDQ